MPDKKRIGLGNSFSQIELMMKDGNETSNKTAADKNETKADGDKNETAHCAHWIRMCHPDWQ